MMGAGSLNSKNRLVFGRRDSGVSDPSKVLVFTANLGPPFVPLFALGCSWDRAVSCDGPNGLLCEGSALKAGGFFLPS